MYHFSITDAVEVSDVPVVPEVGHYRIAPTAGTGLFDNSGQSFGVNQCNGTALGDLDSDGDLDAFVANYGEGNEVWLNRNPPTPTPEPFIHHGDVNGTGSITAEDAQITFNIVLGMYSPTYHEECAADCDGSDSITAVDVSGPFTT